MSLQREISSGKECLCGYVTYLMVRSLAVSLFRLICSECERDIAVLVMNVSNIMKKLFLCGNIFRLPWRAMLVVGAGD